MRQLFFNGYLVQVTPVFDSYWYLAAERQAMFMKRLSPTAEPLTADPILARHRFTNAYRASDRVSQYLLHNVIYNAQHSSEDVIFRVLLFKIFNRIDTWEHLVATIGEPSIAGFDPPSYVRALDSWMAADKRLYSAAYIMPNPSLGHDRKHANHLWLLDRLIDDGTISRLSKTKSLESLFNRLLAVDSFGPFLAYQYAIDINYAPHFQFDEMEFVVPGPGARRGIAKCFADTGGMNDSEVIRAMTVSAPSFLESVGFKDLWGRPLQLIDCQNLFCEVDKYARVAHPELNSNGPARIKQKYSSALEPIKLGYPPVWGLPWKADSPVSFPSAQSSVEGLQPEGSGRYSNVRARKSPMATPPSFATS
jgi:alpha-glutamyl/putrescinyl thymine pyrophosphorylase clade 1